MISIVDNYGEGIPVAWALANRVDTAMLVEFLKPIRERIGPIKTDILCQIWQNNFSLHGLEYLDHMTQNGCFAHGMLINPGKKVLMNILRRNKIEFKYINLEYCSK